MEAIRQIVRIPGNHEVKIKVPEHLAPDELMEVILLIKPRRQSFKKKIKELKKTAKDPMYLEDMNAINQDFQYTDKVIPNKEKRDAAEVFAEIRGKVKYHEDILCQETGEWTEG